MWFFRSPNIVFGEEALSYLNGIHFRRIAVVTDSNIKKLGISDRVVAELPDGSEHMVISDIPEEPTISDIEAGASRISEFAPDLIIGLGGGSCMDASKAFFALYERPDLGVQDITPLEHMGLGRKARLILIPTTSGTGSECTWAAVLSDGDHSRKNEIASPEIIADYAILDPSLVRGLPESVTRNTAVDAITHAIEGRSSQWRNHYSDIFAEKALELIVNNLPKVLEDPSDLQAREGVHIGASMAGIAFSNSQVGMAHAMGHSLGAHFRIPHGVTVGLYLPEVIAFSYSEAIESYSRINSIFPEKYRKEKLYETVREFFSQIGQPLQVDQCGVPMEEYTNNLESLVELAQESTGIVTNPREADSTQLLEIFRSVLK